MPEAELILHGFEYMEDVILNVGAFKKRLRKHVKKATQKNAGEAKKHVKKSIRSGSRFAPNAPSTVRIKGSAKPLVDSGKLVASVSKRQLRWDLAVVGILRSAMVRGPSGSPRDIIKIAKILHEGATIKVTPKMRDFFEEMSRLEPRRWNSLPQSVKVIRIPPRPFLMPVIDQTMLSVYRRHWTHAVQLALHGES